MRIVLPAEALVDGPTALRPWRDSDLAALVAACQDPEISRWTLVPEPYGESDARAYLLGRYEMLHSGISAPFAIVDAGQHDRLLGSISLMQFDWEHRRGRWATGSRARPAARATPPGPCALICAWGFSTLGLERIGLRAGAENPASQRVAERAGFTREARPARLPADQGPPARHGHLRPSRAWLMPIVPAERALLASPAPAPASRHVGSGAWSEEIRHPAPVCTSSSTSSEACWPWASVSVYTEAVRPLTVIGPMLSVGWRTLPSASCIAVRHGMWLALRWRTSAGASTWSQIVA